MVTKEHVGIVEAKYLKENFNINYCASIKYGDLCMYTALEMMDILKGLGFNVYVKNDGVFIDNVRGIYKAFKHKDNLVDNLYKAICWTFANNHNKNAMFSKKN